MFGHSSRPAHMPITNLERPIIFYVIYRYKVRHIDIKRTKDKNVQAASDIPRQQKQK